MMAEADAGDLRLSRVFALTVQALLRRPATALALVLATISLPAFLLYRFVGLPPENVFSLDFLAYLIGTGAVASLSAIVAGWMTLQLIGARARPIVDALKHAPLLMATSFVVFVVLILGILALFIPGIIWSLATAVAIQAAAVERLGPVRAITRSFDLTENRRWAVLGISLALTLPPAIAVGAFEFAINGWELFPAEEHPFITNVSRPVTDTLLSMWTIAMGAALYVELTRLPPAPRAVTVAPTEELTR